MEIPKGVKPELILKKVGEAESFQLVGDQIIKPNGKFVLTYEFKESSAGQLSVDFKPTLDQVITNSNVYQEIAKYVVGSKRAYLDALILASDTPLIALWRLTIKKVIKYADKKFMNILNFDIPGDTIDLAEGDVVLIEGRSDGATNITFDGVIQAREVA